MKNRFLLALALFALAPTLSLAATSDKYKNGDGSFTESAVQLCPNPDGTNTTVSCAANGTEIQNASGVTINPATSEKQDTAQTSLTAIAASVAAGATAAKQDTAQTSLTSIDGKITSTNSKLDQLHTDATAPTPLPPGYSFNHISAAATTVVKSGAGVLHTLSVNNLGTVASVTTVYNNTAGSGAVIAVINTLAGQESYIYDVAFDTGLTVVTTGTVAPDVTVSFR